MFANNADFRGRDGEFIVAEVHESLETTGKNDRRRNCLFDPTNRRLSTPLSPNSQKHNAVDLINSDGL